MSEKRQIDWECIERDYRAGIRSLREIAAEHGISHQAIKKRAERDSWDRDLGAKIKAKAEALVAKREVTAQVTVATKTAEVAVVQANAEAIATVRLSHRSDIRRFKALVVQLLAECEAESGDPSLFVELGEILRQPDDNQQDRLNDAYRKAISLPQRIKGVKELADTLKTLIALEREAWGLASYVEPVQQTAAYETREQQLEGARRLAFSLARAAANTPRPTNG